MSEGQITSYCDTVWVRVGPVFAYTDEFLINAQGDVIYVMCNKLRNSLDGNDPKLQHLRICQTSIGRETVERYDAGSEHWNVQMLTHKTWADYDNKSEIK